ncbi:MAG: MBL fold metallo-hydrolase [Pirellulales bacterium]
MSCESLESRWTLSAADVLTGGDVGVHDEALSAIAAMGESSRFLMVAADVANRALPRRLAAIQPQADAGIRGRAVQRVEVAAAPAALVAATDAVAPAAAPTAPLGDFNGDGKVDRADVAILALNFGRSAVAEFGDGDLTGDGVVSLADLAAVRLGPGAFNITAPAATSIDDTPDVAWTASPGAVRYDATIETAAGCTGELVVQSRTGVAETSAAFDSLVDGVYYACVRAFDNIGNPTDATNNGWAFTIATPPTGSLSIEHSANVSSVSTPGAVVNYSYTVANTGDAPLSNVTVADSRSLALTRQADSPGDGDDLLEAGETWRYAASYTVTQADLSAGVDLLSTATADSDQSDPAMHEAVVFNLFELAEITVGDVRVVPVDHASFVMMWNGLTVYVDPVGPTLFTGLPTADLILITHSHGDHFHPNTINVVADAETQFVTSQTVYNLSSYSPYRTRTTILGYGQSADLLGINVAAVHAYNGNHALNTGNGYVVTIDGRRFYASGDTGPVAEIRLLADIDVAFLCMNVPYTMTVDEAAGVTRDMQPTMVIPYHYRNQGNTYADLARFKSLVGRDLGVEVRLLDWY